MGRSGTGHRWGVLVAEDAVIHDDVNMERRILVRIRGPYSATSRVAQKLAMALAAPQAELLADEKLVKVSMELSADLLDDDGDIVPVQAIAEALIERLQRKPNA